MRSSLNWVVSFKIYVSPLSTMLFPMSETFKKSQMSEFFDVSAGCYVQETAHTSFNQNIGKMVPFPANLSWSVSLDYDRNEKLLKTLQTLYPISLNMTFNSIIIKLLFSTYGNSLYCLIQALICKRLLP